MEDEKALTEFQNGNDDKAELEYREHLTDATSLLTLLLFEHNIRCSFRDRGAEDQVYYEVKGPS